MRRISLLLIIVSLGLCFSLNCNAQFKDEAFQQSYNNDKTAQKDTVDKLFSFKEYFGGLGHKNEMKVGTMFAGSAVFIGGSQIYNKQYWKLPISYAAIIGGVGSGIYFSQNRRPDIGTLCYIGAGVAYWATLLDGVTNYKPSPKP